MTGETQEYKSIRVQLSGDRVEIVMTNGVFGMSIREAGRLASALEDMAARATQGFLVQPSIELWSEGTIGEKVEAFG
jgi:hypothetical protein